MKRKGGERSDLEGMSRLAAHEMQGALQHGARVPERPGGPGVGDGNVEHLGRRRRVLRHFPHLQRRERIKRRRAGGSGVEGGPRRGPGQEGAFEAARAWRGEGRQVSRLPRRARAPFFFFFPSPYRLPLVLLCFSLSLLFLFTTSSELKSCFAWSCPAIIALSPIFMPNTSLIYTSQAVRPCDFASFTLCIFFRYNKV
jgi:hypothetical protein